MEGNVALRLNDLLFKLQDAVATVQTHTMAPNLVEINDIYNSLFNDDSLLPRMYDKPSQRLISLYTKVNDSGGVLLENIDEGWVDTSSLFDLYFNTLLFSTRIDCEFTKQQWQIIGKLVALFVNHKWAAITSSCRINLMNFLLMFYATKLDFSRLDDNTMKQHKILIKFGNRFIRRCVKSPGWEDELPDVAAQWLMPFAQCLIHEQHTSAARCLFSFFDTKGNDWRDRGDIFICQYLCLKISLGMYDDIDQDLTLVKYYGNYRVQLIQILMDEAVLTKVARTLSSTKVSNEDIAWYSQWDNSKAAAMGMGKDFELNVDLFDNLILAFVLMCGCVNCKCDLIEDSQKNGGVVTEAVKRKIVNRNVRILKHKKCKRCGIVYCSRKCQKMHWKFRTHWKVCV